MDGKREVKEIRLALLEEGWAVEKTGSGHWKAIPPDKTKRVVFFGDTVSDNKAIEAIASELKRSGFDYRNRNRLVTPPRVPKPLLAPVVATSPEPVLAKQIEPIEEVLTPAPVFLKTVPLHAFVNQLPDGNWLMSLHITSAVELIRIKTLIGLQEVEGLPKKGEKMKGVKGLQKPREYTHSSPCFNCGEHTLRKRPDRPGQKICCSKIECLRVRTKLRMRDWNARRRALRT